MTISHASKVEFEKPIPIWHSFSAKLVRLTVTKYCGAEHKPQVHPGNSLDWRFFASLQALHADRLFVFSIHLAALFRFSGPTPG
ncbi:MAG: hypothetical protein DMG49_21540 [Acidobacteria bacterium]|nr:MAG: hypothetical protein DMG49_21540 [Acidobacteriota bacterium]